MSEDIENNIPEPAILQDTIIDMFRLERDNLLTISDRYMVIDYPITEEKRQEWKVYRQLLRDLPRNTDLNGLQMNSNFQLINFTWPTQPS